MCTRIIFSTFFTYVSWQLTIKLIPSWISSIQWKFAVLQRKHFTLQQTHPHTLNVNTSTHDKLLTSFSASSLHCTAQHSTAWHLPLSSSVRTVCSSAVGGQSAIHWLLASGFSYLAMTRACSVAPTVTREGPHHPSNRWAFNFACLIINRSRKEFEKLFPFILFFFKPTLFLLLVHRRFEKNYRS